MLLGKRHGCLQQRGLASAGWPVDECNVRQGTNSVEHGFKPLELDVYANHLGVGSQHGYLPRTAREHPDLDTDARLAPASNGGSNHLRIPRRGCLPARDTQAGLPAARPVPPES